MRLLYIWSVLNNALVLIKFLCVFKSQGFRSWIHLLPGRDSGAEKDSTFCYILLDVVGGNPPLFPVASLNLRLCLKS